MGLLSVGSSVFGAFEVAFNHLLPASCYLSAAVEKKRQLHDVTFSIFWGHWIEIRIPTTSLLDLEYAGSGTVKPGVHDCVGMPRVWV